MGLLEPHGRGRRAFRRHALSRPPPVFVVHSLTHAVAALDAAAADGREIVLLSAAEAGIYGGAGWFRALVAAAGAAVPRARFVALLDCGDDAGAVQAAIRSGIGGIVYTGPAATAERLAAIAAAHGARLCSARPPATLDLAAQFFADAETLRAICAAVLATHQPLR